MRIDWWTLGLQTINLLVLLWILGRFLFRPMARIVAERQAEADRILNDAEAARKKAEDAEHKAQAEADAAAARRRDLLDSAQKEAETARQSLLDAARQENARQQTEAEARIAHLEEEADTRIGRRADMLAADIAARILKEPAAHIPFEAFLPGLEAAIATLPDATRDTIGADGAPVTLRTARALSPGETKATHAALEHALGRAITLEPHVDPDVLAGIEIETPTVTAANSLRADVARARAALNAHDRH